ncbi:hypothetical protein HPG69_012290 [Diceros bicornis minor]|uniref:Cytochrome P450 n=1 Tax=Diceros bicornis minor TaxID=77932 RepID=A0A7J7F584_DICBM|nr:hypothetical protein HPG69_012290 [Diceros bicornis minor]
MKVILGRSDPKSHSPYIFLAPWFVIPLIPSLDPTHTPISGPGYGLLLLNGQTCFQHWPVLTPAFHYDILKPYVGLMANSVRVMLVSPSLSHLHTLMHSTTHRGQSRHNVLKTSIKQQALRITVPRKCTGQSSIQVPAWIHTLVIAKRKEGCGRGVCSLPTSTSSAQWTRARRRVNVPLAPQDKWEELTRQDSHLEIFGHVSLRTPDTIMKCAFSHQGSIQADRHSQTYIQAIGDLNNLVFSWERNAFYQNDIIYRLTPDGRWKHGACQLTHQHTDQVIKLRKAHLQKEGELEKVRRKRHLDFLDILLFARMENGSSLSDKDLRAEVDTFMFEGHDTTACSISWILYALATHPRHQQRCLEEIQSLLEDGASITWMGLGFRDHLDQMPYTTMCIKETLRLYPSVPGICRELSKPIAFPDGGSLPRDVFDPSLNCIGKQFAMNELKVAVALALLCFDLAPDPSRVPAPIPRIVLKSKNGIHLHLRKLL